MENRRIKEKKNRQEFEHNLPGPTDEHLGRLCVYVSLNILYPQQTVYQSQYILCGLLIVTIIVTKRPSLL